MCAPTLEDQNFSPDSVFSAAFPDGSSSLAAMDADENPVHRGGSSLQFSPAEITYGQPALPSPDGSSLPSLVIDAPAGTLTDSPSAEPSSSLNSPNLPPPLESLDEASPYSHGEYLYPDYSYKRPATRRWFSGWSPPKESPDNSTQRSPPSVEGEDGSEEPSWLHCRPPTSPLRLPEESPSRWSPQRSDSPEKLQPSPMYSNFLYSTAETEMEPTGVGAGLRNLGNTCFLNVILQCFTHTVPLVQALYSLNHLRPCERGREGFCALCLLCDHIEKALSFSGRTIAPVDFVDNLSNISSCFQRYQQEDAHEFLQCLLGRLDSCCLDSVTSNDMSPQNDKLVEQVFGGRLVSKLMCCNCSHSSYTYEPLIDLSLEIEDVDSLPSALESFTKVEKIEDTETKFTCENCKEAVSVEKQLVLDQAPLVAAFHLKRFKADGSYVVKIDKHVEYPLELDLGPYTCGSHYDNVDLKYDLYAVVVHVGFTPSSGHYFCFVRSSPETWHRLDDSMVYSVRGDHVLSQDAYILFYARKGTPWFSSLMDSAKTLLAPYILNKSPKSVLDNAENNLWPSAVNSDSYDDNEMPDSSERILTEKHEESDVCVTIEMRDAPEGISTGSHEEANVSVTLNAAEGNSAKLHCGPREGPVLSESRFDALVTDAMVTSGASSSCAGTSNDEKVSKSSNNGKSNSGDSRQSDIFHPMTPPISPSPTKSSDGCYLIPLTSMEQQHTCERQSSKNLKVSKKREASRKEAHRYLTRSRGPSLRRATLAAAVYQNKVKRKKKTAEASSIKVSPHSTRHKTKRSSTVVH